MLESEQAGTVALTAIREGLEGPLCALAPLVKSRFAWLEKRFAEQLRQRHYEPRQRKALAAITTLAAVKAIAEGRSIAEFFEQVDYCGRRLAKLETSLEQIAEEIRRAGDFVGEEIRRHAPSRVAEWKGARRQLELAILLALHEAFYKVRALESETFYALFQAELQSRTHDELIARCLEILRLWSLAKAATLFVREPEQGGWRRAGSPLAGLQREPLVLDGSLQRRLSRPRYLKCDSTQQELVLEPDWRSRFACCWSVPLRQGGNLHGVLQLAFDKPYQWLPRELRILTVAAERIMEASTKARLAEALEAQQREIQRLAEQMVHIEEMERKRISQELHDEAGQSLLCLRLRLEMLERQAARRCPGLSEALAEARELAQGAVEEIRRLVRDLSPAMLEHFGLVPAVRRQLKQFERTFRIRARLQTELKRPVPKRLERLLYRLIQECLNNAAKHSRARQLKIVLGTDDNQLRLHVEDDGVGFEFPRVLAQGRGLGLQGMQERVALAGGHLEIKSAPGKGTKVLIELPIPEAVLGRDGKTEAWLQAPGCKR